VQQELKILYFRYFFCGRDDVYAYRVPGRGYRPRRRPKFELTDMLLAEHMRGKVLLGAYPLLRGNETRWVAADFDGENNNAFEEAWRLKEVLEEHEIETICNTSQSGKGVHVRVIFDKNIEAWRARNLMKAFLEREEILPIKDGGAFDRLFPAQDELNTGDSKAIGNQIAMPLNKKAAEERGGCLLLDNDFNTIALGPHTWDCIELYERATKLSVYDALSEAGRHDLLTSGSEREQREAARKQYCGEGCGGDIREPTNDDLCFIIENCEFIDYAMSTRLTYNEWWILATMLIRFDGIGGRRAWHIISGTDSRYNEAQAEKKYDDILSKVGNPVRCSTLSEYGWKCPELGKDGECNRFRNSQGRGPRTPVTIFHFAGSRSKKAA
jgi:hypothetical protein